MNFLYGMAMEMEVRDPAQAVLSISYAALAS
jgi:hypothetical protein